MEHLPPFGFLPPHPPWTLWTQRRVTLRILLQWSLVFSVKCFLFLAGTCWQPCVFMSRSHLCILTERGAFHVHVISHLAAAGPASQRHTVQYLLQLNAALKLKPSWSNNTSGKWELVDNMLDSIPLHMEKHSVKCSFLSFFAQCTGSEACSVYEIKMINFMVGAPGRWLHALPD